MDPQTLAMLAQMLGKGGASGGGGSSNPMGNYADQQAKIYTPEAQTSAAGAVGNDAATAQMNAFRQWRQNRGA